MPSSFRIKIVEAKRLRSADPDGGSDPFVIVKMKGLFKKKFKTKVINHNLNPVWEEEFEFEPQHPNHDQIILKIYDYDTVGTNDFLGMVKLPVINYLNKGIVEEWLPLSGKWGKKEEGEIHVICGFGVSAALTVNELPKPPPPKSPSEVYDEIAENRYNIAIIPNK
ncbi:hypothetical protein PROFUN_13425 [Planoprotostelium fungivorum]|uniref:C2 domain-containing protein n=1 Tax=Planoprotostelium fungivorum TaxID=1890364 RepID=A0A2P6N420_9EUKA|nr:hypothetical protein PROFUN_13425 [Planoprotostelium fungivorum]